MNTNKDISNNFKQLIYIGVIGILFIPMIQGKLKIFNLHPLQGAIEHQEDPYFTKEGWFDGSYQKAQEEFTKNDFGFRPLFVRSHNQIYYTLFKEAKASGVIIGKEGFLYESNYISEYNGALTIGEDSISKKIQYLSEIESKLRAKGKQLLIVLAPGKGSYYPEYIPDDYPRPEKVVTNYDIWEKQLSRSTITYLDFHKWFREIKASAPYPLFPKTGIHWSRYGEIIAADSMVNFIRDSFNINLPEISIDNIETSSEVKHRDDDIEQGMNILENLPDLKMAYPSISSSGGTPAYAITVADSYYWGLYSDTVVNDLFGNGEFWYYNQEMHSFKNETAIPLDQLDIKASIDKAKIVILLGTDANLHRFPFGFEDRMLKSLD